MAATSASLVVVSILSIAVSATGADRHTSAASLDKHGRLNQDANGSVDFIDVYLKQFQKRTVWEVLASHGVQLGVNCSCNLHPKVLVLFEDIKICNAPLVPSWILAVIIGLFSGYKLYSLGPSVTGSLSYSITFVVYALMITSGLIVHCLFLVECGAEPSNNVFVDISKIDGSLTSCIAISFLFNALVDARFIPERAYGTLITMLVAYVWVFYAYFVQLMSPVLLYFATVGMCCGLYLVFQFALTIHNQCQAFGYLFAAGVVGGASLWLFMDKSCWLCRTLGAWSIEGVWYYGSDVAMLLIALYVWKTRRLQGSFTKDTDAKHTERRHSSGNVNCETFKV